MSVLRRFRLPLVLRVFVLGLLVFGVVMKPTVTLACEINGAPASASEYQPVAATDPVAGDACCVVQDCGDCCAHAPVLASQHRLAASLYLSAGPLSVLSVEFEPTAYPVAFRPPIAT